MTNHPNRRPRFRLISADGDGIVVRVGATQRRATWGEVTNVILHGDPESRREYQVLMTAATRYLNRDQDHSRSSYGQDLWEVYEDGGPHPSDHGAVGGGYQEREHAPTAREIALGDSDLL